MVMKSMTYPGKLDNDWNLVMNTCSNYVQRTHALWLRVCQIAHPSPMHPATKFY